MAKYNVKHTCGHEVEHNLFGKNDYREYKISQLECEKCWHCQQIEKVNEMINSGDYKVEEVSYAVYKDNELMAIPNTYNKETKTIKVLVKVKKTEEEVVAEMEKEILQKAENGKVVLTVEDVKELNEKLASVCKKFNLDKKKAIKLFNELMTKYNMVTDKVNKLLILTVEVTKVEFNKSDIMKRAWVIYRDAKTKGDEVSFSVCLKQSWAIAKKEV